ncbi:MAG: hypothetical protein WAT81_03920 [Candidatus Moraniibacteriota bacterium]
MSTFESGAQEAGADKDWEAHVAKLKAFLSKEATYMEIDLPSEAESVTYDDNHEAAKALVAVEDGDFEAANVYLDDELEKVQQARNGETDQLVLARLEIRQSDLQKLKDSLERQ